MNSLKTIGFNVRVVITGASGFVGRKLVARLSTTGHQVTPIIRASRRDQGVRYCVVPDLLNCALEPLLEGAEVVINCAAAISAQNRWNAVAEEINVVFPERLAQAARAMGVRRLVQLSSVAAVMSSTRASEVVTDETEPHPTSVYGRSKLAADLALSRLSSQQMPIISLRPPMIFGPGGKGPFALFARSAQMGLPLPIASVENRRSIAFVDNIAASVVAACESDAAGAFIVTDLPAISTPALYRKLLHAYGRPDSVFRLPESIVVGAARFLLRGRADSLFGNAAYDGSRFRQAVAWQPEVSLDQAIERTIVPAQTAPDGNAVGGVVSDR
ncbi:MAG: NAD-dependent epimerase/dehydratase family protein [Sphingomonas sp.]